MNIIDTVGKYVDLVWRAARLTEAQGASTAPQAGYKYANDAQRVLVSAAASVGARKFWYCTGKSLDNLEVVHGGKFLDEDAPPEPPKGTPPEPDNEAYHAYWNQWDKYRKYQEIEAAYKAVEPEYKEAERAEIEYRKVPRTNQIVDINDPTDTDIQDYERPPSAEEIKKMITSGELLSIEVKDLDGRTKGYALLHRPLLREFEEKELPFDETEKPIAEHLITMGARFLDPIDPKEKPRVGSKEERIEQLSTLQHLMMERLRKISPGTASHVERVGKLALSLFQEISAKKVEFPIEFKMTKEDQDELMIGYLYAVLHDFDKGQVPLSILHYPGNLRKDPNPRKWERMMLHALNTRDALDHPVLQEGDPKHPNASPAIAAAAHHMRPDYSGYPFSPSDDPASPLVGEDGNLLPIPLFTRIIQLIDGYESMSSLKEQNAARTYDARFLIDLPNGAGGTGKKTDMDGILNVLFLDAINGQVDPLLYSTFIHSNTLANDIEENKHMYIGKKEFNALKEITEGKTKEGLDNRESAFSSERCAAFKAACTAAARRGYTTVFLNGTGSNGRNSER